MIEFVCEQPENIVWKKKLVTTIFSFPDVKILIHEYVFKFVKNQDCGVKS